MIYRLTDLLRLNINNLCCDRTVRTERQSHCSNLNVLAACFVYHRFNPNGHDTFWWKRPPFSIFAKRIAIAFAIAPALTSASNRVAKSRILRRHVHIEDTRTTTASHRNSGNYNTLLQEGGLFVSISLTPRFRSPHISTRILFCCGN